MPIAALRGAHPVAHPEGRRRTRDTAVTARSRDDLCRHVLHRRKPCTVENEASILREWLAFHRAVGFAKIIRIDKGGTDETTDIVD
ncbi:glycosyltransferase family 2 protein [Methylobacterium frigidaeris]|uniref:Uncharacterized protein n=1 Tax=Methylobacterium frigidaeris TaxID=2038277 RepID=A0AA37HI77_9HYPH|nr:glycosyltransferase family 2 protein [Methylobacterium frigidaeris]GJD66006.1 hypothetical protein MPEAHAMD_6202 [Methylobacterium frigidaeris]